jgi:hypothetical protein
VSDLDAFFADLDTETGPARLAVDADLQLEFTSAAGPSSTASVTGHGQRIRVQVQRPEVLLTAVERADVGRVADLLAASGITVTVHGPGGPLATLGAGTSTRFGRMVTGSSRVALVPRAAVRVVGANRALPVAAVVGFLAVAVLATIRSLRRSTP